MIKDLKVEKNITFLFQTIDPWNMSAIINKKEANHLKLEWLVIGDDSQASLWIIEKDNEILLMLEVKQVRWCLTNIQLSQWKLQTWTLENKDGKNLCK